MRQPGRSGAAGHVSTRAGGRRGRGVFIDPVKADEGVEHEEDRPHRGDGGLEVLPILGEIEPEAGRGDD
jgi:hypothetical protein